MISFYCSKCHHLIKNEHTPQTEGQSIINESNLCESCTPRPSYIYPNESKTHCKKGHPFDGIMQTKNGIRRYCKTCQKEADKKYLASHSNPHHRKSRGQTPPKLKTPKE